MVPEGWGRVRLGQLLDFQNGVNTEAANYGQGSKFVNVMDIFENRFLTQDRIRGTVTVSPRQDSGYALRRGDILFNRTSETYDEIARSSVYLDDAHAIFGGFVIRGRPKNRKLLPEFSCYCFSSDEVRREMIRRGQGVIRANIGQGDLGDVPLPLPPLPEQKKIAEILSTWDKAIETAEKLLANAEAQKRAFMQQLLTGKRRLKGFEGSEWREVPMVGAFDFINGRAFKPEEWESTGLPIIRIQNLTNSRETLNFFKGEVDKKHRISAGDFLLSWSATLETFIWPGPDAVLNQHIFKVEPRRGVDKNFGYHLITHEIWKLKSKVHGTSMQHITKKSLSTVLTQLPTHKEQVAIARVLDEAHRQCELLKNDLQRLCKEKRALMQQLLTGKRRVAV